MQRACLLGRWSITRMWICFWMGMLDGWMGSGKPLSPHHPPWNVPIHQGTRVEGGRMNGLLGPQAWPPKVGPTGRYLCHLTSSIIKLARRSSGPCTMRYSSSRGYQGPHCGGWNGWRTGCKDSVLPQRPPGAEGGQTSVRDRGTWSSWHPAS